MEPLSCISMTKDDYNTLTISVLRQFTKKELIWMLSTETILPSPEGLPRDWRGLYDILQREKSSRYQRVDSMSKIFEIYDEISLADFIQYLERIDRFDVIEDTEKLIISDIEYSKKLKCSLEKPTLLLTNNSDIDIITEDDRYFANNGLPLPIYDAFLLYDDADENSAKIIVDKLENDFKFKLLLKDRNLSLDVDFEYPKIIKLISSRCNRVIIILSNDILKSSANRFITNYVQSLAIEQSMHKIIPCVFEDCVIPEEFKFHVKLFFNKTNPFCDPWDRLQKAIAPNNYQAFMNSENIRESSQKLNNEKPKVDQSVSGISKKITLVAKNENSCQVISDNLNTNFSKPKITPENASIKENEQGPSIQFEKNQNNQMPKSKTPLNRLMKSIVPTKWGKKVKKRKVGCTNL